MPQCFCCWWSKQFTAKKTSLIFLLDGKGYSFLITRILTELTTSSNQEYYYARMFIALGDKKQLTAKNTRKTTEAYLIKLKNENQRLCHNDFNLWPLHNSHAVENSTILTKSHSHKSYWVNFPLMLLTINSMVQWEHNSKESSMI